MKGPIAQQVMDDGFGGKCCLAGCPVYVDKIERGPRIGVRVTYRHVEIHPVCQTDVGRVLMSLRSS